MILSDEEAKAAQEIAKATGKGIDAIARAGSALVGSTVASISADALGLVGGDWLHQQRARNLARMEDKTARILDGIAAARLSAPSPSVVLPLLQAAADESRDELQDLWAALLANAMIDGGRAVRRDYFEAVKQMEPTDSLVFDILARRPYGAKYTTGDAINTEAMNADMKFAKAECARLSVNDNDFLISREKLATLGCLTEWNTNYLPHMSAFGRGLLAACKVL